MSSVDTMDIPEIKSVPVAASAAVAGEPPSKRRKPSRDQFCERIRGAAGWFSTMQEAQWKNVTTEKSRRTLFVLQAPGWAELLAARAAREASWGA